MPQILLFYMFLPSLRRNPAFQSILGGTNRRIVKRITAGVEQIYPEVDVEGTGSSGSCRRKSLVELELEPVSVDPIQEESYVNTKRVKLISENGR